MEPVLQWGLDVIKIVQSVSSPPLDAFMKFITSFGSSAIFIILLPLVYWCVDEKKGFRLCVMVLISMFLNLFLKEILGQPRPPSDLWLTDEILNGLPSGHAQNTIVLYFMLASFIIEKFPQYKKNIYTGAAVLCFLTGFSRIYLGVHYPTDVLGGWVVGGAVLYAYFALCEKLEALIVKGGHRAGMITSAAASFVMIALDTFFDFSVGGILIAGGLMLGMGAGYCLNRKYAGFKSSFVFGKTDLTKHFILFGRLLLGLSGFILIALGISKIIPHDSPNLRLYIFAEFAICGLWVSFAAPWVFVKLRLAETSFAQKVSEGEPNTNE